MNDQETELAIKTKMAAGLSREQAVEVIKTQAAHDAAIAAETTAIDNVRSAARNHAEEN